MCLNNFLGNILYKTLGCWREDDSLEKVVSLEGTDPVLVDSYKLRQNSVTRCATAARKRSFKGWKSLCNFNVVILTM